MGAVKMTLQDVMGLLTSLDPDATIYSSGTSGDSEAVVAVEPDDGGVPPEATGMRYLLEVSIAKEVVRVWQEWHESPPTEDEKLKAVVYYAENDTYMP